MIFSTYWFLLFFAAFLPAYWLARPNWLRLVVLLLGCTVFHARFAGPAGMVPIIVLCVTTYLAGLSRRPWVQILGMIPPVLALLFYKYSHFIALKLLGSLCASWGAGAEGFLGSKLPSIPPLGVSFFVFEFVHYLYDVRKGSEPIRNPARFWAFVFFFPSLVAGPVKRYQAFNASLSEGLSKVSLEDLKYGVWRLSCGFAKKLLLADNLTAAVEYWHERYEGLPLWGRWGVVVAINFRILFDFSAYSDMAIGAARLMGIRLAENFNWPYLARNLSDFWRRWHMSLSSWIRDYVYIPLGGSRHGFVRRILNGLIDFALCGLWHGPDWNYVLWGVLHGVGLSVSSSYRAIPGGLGSALGVLFDRVPLLSWALTLTFVMLAILCFFYPVPEFLHMTRLLFVLHP